MIVKYAATVADKTSREYRYESFNFLLISMEEKDDKFVASENDEVMVLHLAKREQGLSEYKGKGPDDEEITVTIISRDDIGKHELYFDYHRKGVPAGKYVFTKLFEVGPKKES